MSKYFNALAVAVLGMALLMGAASAATASAVVTGEVQAQILSFDAGPSGADLAAHIEDTGDDPITAQESITVTTNIPYNLDVADQNAGANKGYMLDTATSLIPLANPLNVDGSPLTSSVNIETSHAVSAGDVLTFDYSQTFTDDDAVGSYDIALTYTLAWDGV